VPKSIDANFIESLLLNEICNALYICKIALKMNKTELKEKILNTCKLHLLQTIDNLKSAMEEAQKAANEYGPPKDRYDSFRTQLLRKRDMFAQQLTKANEQMDILNRIDPEKVLDKVEFGSVVITDKQKMFISIGLGKLHIDDLEFYAISPFVPIFNAMRDKKKGEEFVFNSNKFIIKDIY
jgi:hypothetical protein